MWTLYTVKHPHTDPLRTQNQKTLSIAVWISPVHPSNKLVCYHCCWEVRKNIGIGVIYDGALSFHPYLGLCLAQQLWSKFNEITIANATVHLWLSRDLTLSFWPVSYTTLMSFHLLTWRIHMVGAGKWTWILRRKSQCS